MEAVVRELTEEYELLENEHLVLRSLAVDTFAASELAFRAALSSTAASDCGAAALRERLSATLQPSGGDSLLEDVIAAGSTFSEGACGMLAAYAAALGRCAELATERDKAVETTRRVEGQLREAQALNDALLLSAAAARDASDGERTARSPRSAVSGGAPEAHAAAAGASSSEKIEVLAGAIGSASASQGERVALAEQRAAQLEAQLQHAAHASEAELGALRLRATEAEGGKQQLMAALGSLRDEVELQQVKAAAKDAVIAGLRQELADSQAKLARLQSHKAEMAASAAGAMRELEAQVQTLTDAVLQLKREQHTLERIRRPSADPWRE
jgi:chromosome segregation ATPase